MKAKKIALGLLAVLVVAGCAGWFSLDKETRGLLATLPTNRDVLFWSQPQRDAAFRALDRLPILAKSRVVPAGGTPMPLPPGPPLPLPLDVDAYMAGQRSAALLIVIGAYAFLTKAVNCPIIAPRSLDATTRTELEESRSFRSDVSRFSDFRGAHSLGGDDLRLGPAARLVGRGAASRRPVGHRADV
jgi:hypothetical protein